MIVDVPNIETVVAALTTASASGLLHARTMAFITIEEVARALSGKCPSEPCQRIAKIKGVGSTTATAIVAAIGDGSDFKNGRHLAAWIVM